MRRIENTDGTAIVVPTDETEVGDFVRHATFLEATCDAASGWCPITEISRRDGRPSFSYAATEETLDGQTLNRRAMHALLHGLSNALTRLEERGRGHGDLTAEAFGRSGSGWKLRPDHLPVDVTADAEADRRAVSRLIREHARRPRDWQAVMDQLDDPSWQPRQLTEFLSATQPASRKPLLVGAAAICIVVMAAWLVSVGQSDAEPQSLLDDPAARQALVDDASLLNATFGNGLGSRLRRLEDEATERTSEALQEAVARWWNEHSTSRSAEAMRQWQAALQQPLPEEHPAASIGRFRDDFLNIGLAAEVRAQRLIDLAELAFMLGREQWVAESDQVAALEAAADDAARLAAAIAIDPRLQNVLALPELDDMQAWPRLQAHMLAKASTADALAEQWERLPPDDQTAIVQRRLIEQPMPADAESWHAQLTGCVSIRRLASRVPQTDILDLSTPDFPPPPFTNEVEAAASQLAAIHDLARQQDAVIGDLTFVFDEASLQATLDRVSHLRAERSAWLAFADEGAPNLRRAIKRRLDRSGLPAGERLAVATKQLDDAATSSTRVEDAMANANRVTTAMFAYFPEVGDEVKLCAAVVQRVLRDEQQRWARTGHVDAASLERLDAALQQLAQATEQADRLERLVAELAEWPTPEVIEQRLLQDEAGWLDVLRRDVSELDDNHPLRSAAVVYQYFKSVPPSDDLVREVRLRRQIRERVEGESDLLRRRSAEGARVVARSLLAMPGPLMLATYEALLDEDPRLPEDLAAVVDARRQRHLRLLELVVTRASRPAFQELAKELPAIGPIIGEGRAVPLQASADQEERLLTATDFGDLTLRRLSGAGHSIGSFVYLAVEELEISPGSAERAKALAASLGGRLPTPSEWQTASLTRGFVGLIDGRRDLVADDGMVWAVQADGLLEAVAEDALDATLGLRLAIDVKLPAAQAVRRAMEEDPSFARDVFGQTTAADSSPLTFFDLPLLDVDGARADDIAIVIDLSSSVTSDQRLAIRRAVMLELGSSDDVSIRLFNLEDRGLQEVSAARLQQEGRGDARPTAAARGVLQLKSRPDVAVFVATGPTVLFQGYEQIDVQPFVDAGIAIYGVDLAGDHEAALRQLARATGGVVRVLDGGGS
jgi:hypothetical protein